MAITVLATTKARYTGPSTGCTTPAFDSTGATLIEATVAYYTGGGGSLALSDSKGNVWTSHPPVLASGSVQIQKFHTYGQAGVGSGHTLTISGLNQYAACVVRAYGGERLFHHSATRIRQDTGTALSTGSVTPAQAPALVTSGILENTGTGPIPTATAPMSFVDGSASVAGQAVGVAVSDELQTTATARDPGWTWATSRATSGVTACYATVPSPIVAVAVAFWGSGTGETGQGVDTTGATFLVASVASTGDTLSVSDNKGNAWTALPLTKHSSGSGVRHRIFYVRNPIVGTNHRFTSTGGSGTFPTAIVYALSGPDRLPHVVRGATSTVSGAGTLASGPISTQVDGALIFSGISVGNGTSSAVDSGLIESVNVYEASSTSGAAQQGQGAAWLIQTSAGTINPVWTFAGGSQYYAAAAAAFVPVPASGIYQLGWTSADAPGSSNGTSAALDTTGADLLVASLTYYSGGSMSVSDSKGNTWALAVERIQGGTDGIVQRIYYVQSPIVGTGHTFTISGSGWRAGRVIVIAFKRAHLTAPADVTNGDVKNGTSPLATGSITPSVNGALIVSGFGENTADGVDVDSAMTVHRLPSVANTFDHLTAWKLQAVAAAINPTWTWTGTTQAATVIASFKPASVAPVAVERVEPLLWIPI